MRSAILVTFLIVTTLLVGGHADVGSDPTEVRPDVIQKTRSCHKSAIHIAQAPKHS